MLISSLIIGKKYSNDDIMATFKCGNMGGMRRSHKTNTLVLISDHTKGFYDDMWHGTTLHYTGMGKTGDQTLNGNQNKTLSKSVSNGVHVHLFEVLVSSQYIYRGEVKLVDEPYQDEQKDIKGNMRKVWIFPIKPINAEAVVTPAKYTISEDNSKDEEKKKKHYEDNASEDFAAGLSDSQLKEAAVLSGKKKPKRRTVSSPQIDRDVYVAEYVKRRAKGICDLCGEQAPFIYKGMPFLECHHVIWLSRGGEDTIRNAVALCSNCHSRVHLLDDPSDVKKLMDKLSDYESKGL